MEDLKMENKQEILKHLTLALQATRAGSDIVLMEYIKGREEVCIYKDGNHVQWVNVACDSGISMIRDICKALY